MFMFIFLVSTVFLHTNRLVVGNDIVVRAYIQNKHVKEFNSYLNNHTEIDTWLSTRLVENYPKLNLIDKDYKYFTEFRIKKFDLLNELKYKFNIKYNVLIKDLNHHLNSTSKAQKRSIKINSKVVGKYASYSEISSWMLSIAKKYPHLVQIRKIGKTFEKRTLFALRLTNNPKAKDPKPLFLYDGGIHAREWLSVATVIYMIDKLIKQFESNEKNAVKLLKSFELHFIPLINPDGYEYSRASKFNRYWRKNMRHSAQHSSDHVCYGIDLNRNFDHKWMVSGASANPCSEVYAGRYPGSEAEIKAIQDYIMSKSPRWASHISLHSYGAIWLSPFSYSKFHIQDNFEQTCHKALTAIKKIETEHNFKFRFGMAAHELYEASGCSEDWSKDVAKVNHTFVIELKPDISDSPESGFEHPEDKIEEASNEVYDGFIEYMNTFLNYEIEKPIIEECKQRFYDLKEYIDSMRYEE